MANGQAAAALTAFFGVALATWAGAQGTHTRVDVKNDWSIFAEEIGGNKICWIVSRPTESAAFRGGNRVQVRRGEIYMTVSIRPGDGTKNEVSFISGYPFQQGSTVSLEIDGGNEQEMFTDGEHAWLSSPDEDDKAVASFRRGLKAEVTGTSSRGTRTVDTFSLRGFTAAITDARRRCN